MLIMSNSSVVPSFADLWHCKDMHSHIHNIAASNGGSAEDIEDMESEAWAVISRANMGMMLRDYKDQAKRAIFSEYWQQLGRRNNESTMDILEISNGSIESLNYYRARAKRRYAGQGLLRKACKGIHGTICSNMLTFEIAIALQSDNTDWLGCEEYFALRDKAEKELAETEHLEESE